MNYQVPVLGNSYFESRNRGCQIKKIRLRKSSKRKVTFSRRGKSNWRIIQIHSFRDSKGNSKAQSSKLNIFSPESWYYLQSLLFWTNWTNWYQIKVIKLNFSQYCIFLNLCVFWNFWNQRVSSFLFLCFVYVWTDMIKYFLT